jgi:hypothetical protein
VPATPAEWRDSLVARLDQRWAKIKVYDDYYEGRQELAYATRKFREVYGGLFTSLADNWMQIVVDSSVERLRVQGFRFGDSQDADDDAWAIWQANGLDGEANMLHTEAVKLSEAYWMVQPNGEVPKITAEHPSQCIVAHAPGDRRTRLAGLKKWLGDDRYIYANVYLPDRVVKYRTRRYTGGIVDALPDVRTTRWETIGASSNPLGVVPIIPAPNNPSMIHGGRSDLAGGPVSLQDAINKLCADQLVGSESTAFRQRLLLGVDQPRGADGKPVPLDQIESKVAQSKVLFFPGKDAKAAEFGETNLGIVRDAIRGFVDDLVAQTRTPPHYVVGKMANLSGDALKAAETGLVAKVRDKMDPFGEAHEEAMRLAFRAIDPDDPRASATDAETIWRDPESRSQAELADALTKLATIGVPQEILWEKYGFSPQEIDRMKAMQEADALLTQSLVPQTNGQPTPAMQEAMSAGLSSQPQSH